MPEFDNPGFVIWLCGSAAQDLRLSLFDELRARLMQRGIAPSLFVLDSQADRQIEFALSLGSQVATAETVFGLLGDDMRIAVVLGSCAIGHGSRPDQGRPIRMMSACAPSRSDPNATGEINEPDLTVRLGTDPVAHEADRILSWLTDAGWIASAYVHTLQDEEILLRRLQDLGYL